MAARLEKLTPELEALIPVVRDEWLRIGWATGDGDRAEAERGVAMAYRAAGLEPPGTIVWLDSPLAGIFGAYLLASGQEHAAQVSEQVEWQVEWQVREQVREQAWRQVRGQVREQVGVGVGEQVSGQVLREVRERIYAQVSGQVLREVRERIYAQVLEQVREQVLGQVDTRVLGQVETEIWWPVHAQVRQQALDHVWMEVQERFGEQVYRASYGQHSAGWMSFYQFFREAGIVAACDLDGLALVARHAGWWWPFENVAILTRRPAELRRDEEGRLHSASGPALRYPDGFAVHSWHGTRVPAEWIESPETLSPETAITWENAEQRRCAAEILGWDRIIRHVGAQTIDEDPDPMTGTLLEATLDGRRERFLRVLCGTGRTFALPVPPDVETAAEAQFCVWDDDSYAPEVQT